MDQLALERGKHLRKFIIPPEENVGRIQKAMGSMLASILEGRNDHRTIKHVNYQIIGLVTSFWSRGEEALH